MDRKVEFVWSDKPAIYLVRDQLEKGNCDVVMGVDTGDDRLLTTKPYYRAPYVFVERSDSPLDITSFDSPDLMKTGKIAFEPGTPAEVMITKLDLYNRNFNYIKSLTNFKSPRNQYVRIDPTAWSAMSPTGHRRSRHRVFSGGGPLRQRRGGKLKMVVIPDNNTRTDGEKVPFHFDQSIGVRKTDAELLGEIDTAIEKAQPQIQAVLQDEGIPLVSSADRRRRNRDLGSPRLKIDNEKTSGTKDEAFAQSVVSRCSRSFRVRFRRRSSCSRARSRESRSISASGPGRARHAGGQAVPRHGR